MSDATLAWRQYRLERRMFWRNPTAAFFSFLLPLMFLALFGAIFSGDQRAARGDRPGDRRPQHHGDDVQRARQPDDVPARAGRAQADPRHAAARQRLPRGRARQRGDERADPDRARRARLASSSSASAGRRTGPSSRSSPSLGVACFASLGVAFSHVIPNFDAAPAYTNLVFLPMIFISGVFYDVDNVPAARCATSPRRCRSST